jgi:DNA-directed RNA polymerase subunit RPC12/RpoP
MAPTKRKFPLEDVADARDQYLGFCLECGAIRETVEPDARQYKCDECGELAVYGAEEILFIGLVE